MSRGNEGCAASTNEGRPRAISSLRSHCSIDQRPKVATAQERCELLLSHVLSSAESSFYWAYRAVACGARARGCPPLSPRRACSGCVGPWFWLSFGLKRFLRVGKKCLKMPLFACLTSSIQTKQVLHYGQFHCTFRQTWLVPLCVQGGSAWIRAWVGNRECASALTEPPGHPQ